jgi:integrase
MKIFNESKDKMLQSNFDALKKHIQRLQATDATKENHIQALLPFGIWCKKPFKELTEDDIYDYISFLDNYVFEIKGVKRKYSAFSKYQKMSSIRVFLKGINPEAIKSIKIKPAKNNKLPEEILTKEEIESLLNACQNARDRALISLMYESGARKGEFQNLKIKNVQFDENGCVVIFPEGKTGARRVRLVFSSSYLREWLEYHPAKNNKESFLFVSLESPHPQLSTTGLKEQIVRIAQRAGITKKVNPHSFRHARATHLAEHLTEQQMKKYLGWTQGSNMAAVYVHLSGKDVDNAILKMNGIMIDDTHTDGLKVGKCPRCHEINPEIAKFCFKCGLPLTQEAVKNVESIKADYMQLSDLDEIREMKNSLKQELEEIAKLKEALLTSKK